MRTLLLIVLFCAPVSVSAQLVITEVMYDLEGRDGGREWIEVLNAGTEPVTLSNWSFFEGSTNHRLSIHQGNDDVASGMYVIIADKPNEFLSDHPGFSGAVYDSAFSLSNSGETLSFRDSQDMVFGALSYSSAWGAEGNGYSLQLFNGEWIEAPPTPGGPSAGRPAPKPVVEERDIAPVKAVVETEPQEEEVEPEPEEEAQEDTDHTPLVARVDSPGTPPIVLWIGGLVALILGGVIVVLLARKEQKEEFEIIDGDTI